MLFSLLARIILKDYLYLQFGYLVVKSVWERWDKYAILSFHLSNCLGNELVPYHHYIINLNMPNGLTTIIIIEAQNIPPIFGHW